MRKKRKFGIVEILKHDLLDSYPVLYERDGETIVQFKFTGLILSSKTERLNTFTLPHVTSEYSIDSDEHIQSIMALETEPAKKKKKKPNKKKKKPQQQEVEEQNDDEENNEQMETDE